MTPDAAKKHSKVIKWFCDNADKGVWGTLDPSATIWELIYDPSFAEQHTFVQNDNYAELRKAQAEGKVIQHNTISINHALFNDIVENYRIKPDEPEFKIGDWMYDRVNHRIFLMQKDTHYAKGGVELWTPKRNEWCIFYHDNPEEYSIAKFSREDKHVYPYIGKKVGRFKNIAPFTPDFIEILRAKDAKRT